MSEEELHKEDWLDRVENFLEKEVSGCPTWVLVLIALAALITGLLQEHFLL